MKNKEEIINKLFNEFLDKDLSILLEGSITTDFVIKNAKIVMSNKTLMITDNDNKELIICLDDVTDTKIHNCITFEIDTQKITIDF